MRVQSFFAETRIAELHRLMREQPFATLIAQRDGHIDANHLPLLLLDEGEYGTLHGHAARSLNFDAIAGQEVLVLFQGEHAYVSPSWYETKRETGKAVPTWNYVVVHAYGQLNVIDDAVWVRRHLEQMTDTHERGRVEPWKVSDAPEDYTRKMLGALVGIEVKLTKLVGKFKLSQNRTPEDRVGVIAGLRAEDMAGASAVAERMERNQS